MKSTPAEEPQVADALDSDKNLSLAESVYLRIRNGIRAGEFRPGDRMRETELAARLDVSRTPIREAIRRLASDGLVEVAPSRGVMITRLDRQQVRELYTLRASLEGTAAGLAAQHASRSEAEEMHDAIMAPATEDPEALARRNRLFHKLIHDAARNRYLAQALLQLSDTLALLPGTTFEVPGRASAARDEHLAVLSAIERGDPDAAEQAARLHIQRAGLARMRMMFDDGAR